MGESIQLVKGSTTYKIFKFVQKKGAVTSPEIIEGLKDLNIKPNHIGSYFRELIKKELVIKSKEKVQSPTRKESKLNVYGVSKEAIRRKMHQYSQKTQSDKAFLVGIKKQMFDILTDSPLGFTLAEVVYKLRELEGREDYGNWDYVGNTLREMALTNLIARSSFKIPANQMIYGRKPGFVYGRDKQALFDKVVKLMPKEVRKAYLEIIQSNEIFPADILVKKFGIEDGLIRSWFINRLIPTGWVKTYSYKQRRYYYNPKIPESYVAERVPKIHEEEVVKSILENSTLGNEFEKQAIFYFVMYLITKRGCQVRLNKDFPKKIPSWFNRDDIRNPEYVVLDKDGNPTGKTLVDVWRFDNEPFDYFVFTYDEVLESPAETYAISIKRDQNRKYLGIAGKRYMASMWGCLSMGMSLDLKRIPKRTSIPVLIVNGINSNRLFAWADKMNCDVYYKSRFEKIVKYLNNLGIRYAKDKVLAELKQEFDLLQRYRNHESVVLGKVTPEQLVRWDKK